MRIKIKIVPRSSRHELVIKDGAYKAYLKAAPDKGKANRELIDLVSETSGVPKSNVRILSGASGRTKTLEVRKQ